jgi:hypothetical protein
MYPNTSLDLLVHEQVYTILWDEDTDQLVVKRGRYEQQRRLKRPIDPNKLDFYTDPEKRRADATYSVNVENNRLRIKYMDGHRFQSVVLQ